MATPTFNQRSHIQSKPMLEISNVESDIKHQLKDIVISVKNSNNSYTIATPSNKQSIVHKYKGLFDLSGFKEEEKFHRKADFELLKNTDANRPCSENFDGQRFTQEMRNLHEIKHNIFKPTKRL